MDVGLSNASSNEDDIASQAGGNHGTKLDKQRTQVEFVLWERSPDRSQAAYSGSLGLVIGSWRDDYSSGRKGIHMHPLVFGTLRNLINRSALGHRVIVIGLTMGAAILWTQVAFATPLSVDLGSTGVVHGSRTVDLPAPSVQFQGQNITIDFSFQNSQFIRLFTATESSFQMDAFFRINNAPLSDLNFSGSGHLVGQGGALGPTISLQAFPVTDLLHQVGVDFLLRPLTSNAVPDDICGIHLDLTLPDSPEFGFGGGQKVGGVTFTGNVFGIGPGVPRDVIPDTGSTGFFLAITLGVIFSVRRAHVRSDRLIGFAKSEPS